MLDRFSHINSYRMSKSEEKSSKRKASAVDVPAEEPKPEKAEKKSKKEKKEKKEKSSSKKSTQVVAENAEPSTSTETADVEMTASETTPAEDSTTKKRKRSKETTNAEESAEKPEDDADLLEIDPDAPTPLSKAQARAARKEAKRKSKAGGDAAEDSSEGEDGAERTSKRAKKSKTEVVKPKRQHSVWIGNLAFKTNAESLKAWLEREIILLSKGKPQEPEEGDEDEEPEEGDDDEVDEETEIITRVNMPMKQGRFGVQNQGSVDAVNVGR
jgi:hypothetical protein